MTIVLNDFNAQIGKGEYTRYTIETAEIHSLHGKTIDDGIRLYTFATIVSIQYKHNEIHKITWM